MCALSYFKFIHDFIFPTSWTALSLHIPNTKTDPHFVSFGGEAFSYHGECDLVLMRSTGYASGLGIDIHIRTTRVDSEHISYSYISGVAVKIGPDVLEAMDDGSIVINGDTLLGNIEDNSFDAFRLHSHMKGKKKQIFVHDLDLSKNESIQIRCNTKTGMLFVDVKGIFSDSIGLLGTSDKGTTSLLARDGQSKLSGEWNTFGEEWQVRPNEPKLFQDNRNPQYPAGCQYKSARSKPRLRRRLMDPSENVFVDIDVATEICSQSADKKKKFCIDDVLATHDIELAEDPFYKI